MEATESISKKSHQAPTDVPRLPRSDIPADLTCPYPECVFTASKEFGFTQHMVMRHGVYYELASTNLVALKAKHGSSRYDLEKLETLAPWHCVALARYVVYGQPFSEIAKEMRHSPDSVKAVSKSPAGQAFIARMTQELTDPVKLVKDLMKSDALEMHLMWLQARDWAFADRNADLIHKMAKEVGLQPVLADAEKAGPTKIVLNMNMGDLATPVISSRFEIVKDAEWKEEAASDGGDSTAT